jgi:hypothetical protein
MILLLTDRQILVSEKLAAPAEGWNVYCSILAVKRQPREQVNSAVRFDEG